MNYSKYIKDLKYKNIVLDILENNEFKKLENILHHGGTRYEHSLKVSYYSYKIAKILGLDYESVARAGLLHDFYFDRTIEKKKIVDKIKLFSTVHPRDAVTNANKLFYLYDKEIDIIESHMFPIDYRIPKYAESWIVCLIDKIISFKEFGVKFNYQLSTTLNVWLLLLINLRK